MIKHDTLCSTRSRLVERKAEEKGTETRIIRSQRDCSLSPTFGEVDGGGFMHDESISWSGNEEFRGYARPSWYLVS